MHLCNILFSITLLFISKTLAQSCEVNSLYNSTCNLNNDLKVERNDKNILINKNNCDTLYNKEDFGVMPGVTYSAAQPNTLYTLLMADPDAVNLKPDTYVLHWMVANIKGEDFINGNLKDSLTIKAYHPPSPPANSGIHRYQFIVYTQEKKIYGQVAHADRANFLLESWLESTEQSVCGPVAGVQFRVKAMETTTTVPTTVKS